MNYAQSDKKLFFEVFASKGKNSWTNAFKKKYIYTVQQQSGVSNKKLAENIISEDVTKIFSEIIKYDDNLGIFKQFLKSHESLARKSVELHRFSLNHDEKDLVKSLENIAYDYKIPKNWKVIELVKSDKEITITLSKGAYHKSNLTIEKDKLESTVWEKLSANVLKLTDNKYSSLTSIKTELMEETRVISKMKFDIKNDVLEFAIDNSYIQENGKKASDEQYEKDIEEIVKEVSKTIHLTDNRKQSIQAVIEEQEESLFTKKVFNKLLTLKQSDFIIVPTVHHFHNEDGTNTEQDEDIVTSQRKQRLAEIEKKVKDYYALNGTLIGFFEKHSEHKTSDATFTSQLLSDTTTTKFHAFAILVRDITTFEKDTNKDKMKGKTIDSIIFDFDVNDKRINIKNNNYTEEIYEAIISKILEFSKKD